jgi:phosphatidate cytidylyltransferase
LAESEILTRLAVGLVLVALTVLAVVLGGLPLLILLLLAVSFATREVLGMKRLLLAVSFATREVLGMKRVDGTLTRFIPMAGAIFVALGFFVGQPTPFVVITLLAVMSMTLADHRRATVASMATVLFAVIYPSLFVSHILLLRRISVAHACLPLLCIWTFDTAAYLVGRTFGRIRLAPGISPGKSLEGTAGGVICVALVALIAKATFAGFLSTVAVLSFAIVVAVAGQVGDLFESWMKRTADLKDSSATLPGHGGVLDRIDSLAFAIPVAYYFILWTSATRP